MGVIRLAYEWVPLSGSLRSYRQCLQAILTNEYGFVFGSCIASTTGKCDGEYSTFYHWRTLTVSQFLWFPCGVIRGGLSSMGINATVQAETSELPAATFQIKTLSAKS